ncbi:MAG: chemotaxis protein CheW [Burkholderiales bacterium]|nr:chemotaxis protein CheW [Burkholderiales bacterium]
MAARLSLRDYQQEFLARLQRAETDDRPVSKLGLEAGGSAWLVDLTEAGELIPVPPVWAVPLARSWFRGIANIRGNLYSVVDFAAFLGGETTTATDRSRLLLISDRFRAGCALLVGRSLGLLKSADLEPCPRDGVSKWTRAEYADAAGRRWSELDVPALVRSPEFLDVST